MTIPKIPDTHVSTTINDLTIAIMHKLLEPAGEVTIEASTAHDSFSIEDLNIVECNDLFNDEILSQMGKASKATTARQHKLKDSIDALTMVKLGAGVDPSTVAFSPDQFRVWLQTAKHVRHIIYVQGKTKVLAVVVRQVVNSWGCYACSILQPIKCSQGSVIVSRQDSNLGT